MRYNLLDDEELDVMPKDNGVPVDISEAVAAGVARNQGGYPSDLSDVALADAQSRSNESRLYANLGDAFDTLGRGIAGASKPVDSAYYKGLAEQSSAPVEQIQARRKGMQDLNSFNRIKALQDPGSTQSIVAQRLAKQRISAAGGDPSIIDGLSAQDISDFEKSIGGLESTHNKQQMAEALKLYRENNLGLRDRSMGNREKEQDLKRSTISDKQTEDINNFDSAIANAEELVNAYKQGFTGPANQYKSSLIGKQFADPEAVTYQSKIGRNSDVYRKIITGAAAADKELARIESRLPQVNDPEPVFKAKAADYIAEVRRAKQRYLDNLSKKGKNVSEFKSEAPSPASAPSLKIDQSALEAEMKRRGLK